MHLLKWIHVGYVGFWSVFLLFSTALGLLRGSTQLSDTDCIHLVLQLLVAAIGIATVFFCSIGKRTFNYLLFAWWIPQLFQVTVGMRTPTYPQNVMIPLYLIAAGPTVSVALIHELDVDKLLFLRFNLVAVIGVILALIIALGRTQSSIRRNAEPAAVPDRGERPASG